MNYLNFLIPTLEGAGGLGYWIVFLIAFTESFAFVGNLIPGSILIYLAGFMASRGYFNIVTLIWFTAAGAALGDGLSYLLGTKGKKFFRDENKFLKLSHLEKGEHFFHKYGSKSVFFGRFVGPLRPIIPFIAGLSKMDKKLFFLWDISSVLLWTLLHLFVGYFFGSAIDIVEAWTTRAGLIIVSFGAALAIVWLLLKKSRPFFAFLKLSFISARDKVRSSSLARNLNSKYPVQARFLRERFSVEKFYGLPLSLASIGFIYILFLFFGSVQNALSSSAIALSDKRIADLMFSFRDRELVIFFTWVMLLAKWQVIAAFAIAATLAMRFWRKEFYIPAMWGTVAVAEFLNYVSGIVFYRSRPDTSVYFKTSSSFPSSHSVMSAAFYGFVVYVLARNSRNWGRKTNIIFSGIAVISGIGFSALYLGESFLSDVWGGYLLGILCLMIGISLAEFLRTREKTATAPDANAKSLTIVFTAVCLLFYAVFSAQYHPALSVAAAVQSPVKVADAADIFSGDKVPRLTEKLFGDKAQALSFIIVSKDDGSLAGSMEKAGWTLADKTGVGTVLKLVKAEITNQSYDQAPMTPSFWNAGVNYMGFEKQTAAMDIYSRRHIRIWKTNFTTSEGRVYVATARLDTVKWIFMHSSSPDIDAEREILFSDLNKAGEIARSQKLQFTEPVKASKDLSDVPFFTDGKLYEIVLK